MYHKTGRIKQIFKKRNIKNNSGIAFITNEIVHNHTKDTLDSNYAGAYVVNPSRLSVGTHVTVFQKNSKNWWEHGEIYNDKGTKVIGCGDVVYKMEQVEVYLDSRYEHTFIHEW